jgi:hypothetical protein
MTKRKRKAGRPNRREASSKALAGVDVTTVDPFEVLRTIAADVSAPASARVAAAKALVADSQKQPEDEAGDPVSRHALRILKGGRA